MADDDVWADEPDAEYERGRARRDEQRLENQFKTVGLREGVNEGKRDHVQPGFNRGFAEGLPAGMPIGRLRGMVVTLRALGALDALDAEQRAAIDNAERRLIQLEDGNEVFTTEFLVDPHSKDVPQCVIEAVDAMKAALAPVLKKQSE